MNKEAKYTYNGANQDISRSKHLPQFYYEAAHIKLLATDGQASKSIANEKGNELVLTIPEISIDVPNNTITYGSNSLFFTTDELEEQFGAGVTTSTNTIIIGHAVTRVGIILFTTNDQNIDGIWLVDNVLNDSFNIELLYTRNLNFSINNPIQAIFNFENENIQKVYWVDNLNQIRHLNTTYDSIEENEDALIDTPSNTLNFVGEVSFSQPIIQEVTTGGTHTSGMIQYAYNLYRLNSSQTKISPLSEIIPLDKGDSLGGGDVNEVVGATPIVRISDVDTTYTHIRVYAIKYTSYNEIPSINLIEERELDSDEVIIYDDGSVIEALTLEEFVFLGSDPVVPQHIETKDNTLLLANLTTQEFILPKSLDCRAYSFPINSTTTKVFDNISSTNEGVEANITVTSTFTVPTKYDAINLNYDTRRYQFNSSIEGGEGKFFKYELLQKTEAELDDAPNEYRFFKDREIYRIGLQFYNKLGQVSLPQWMADFKAPSGNLEGNYNVLKVELKPEFYVWLNTSSNFENDRQIPVGFKVVRANRTIVDKSILCQGIVNPMCVNSLVNGLESPQPTVAQKRIKSDRDFKRPSPFMRLFQHVEPIKSVFHLRNMQNGAGNGLGNARINPYTEVQFEDDRRRADSFQYTVMGQIYSPEILFDNVSLDSGVKFNVVGGVKNTTTNWWGREITREFKNVDREGKVLGGVTPWVSGTGITNIPIAGSIFDLLDRGLISDGSGREPDIVVTFNQFYREFTTFVPATNLRAFSIYGAPELTELGQGLTTYAGDTKYKYLNSLEGFTSDGEDNFDEFGSVDRTILTINTHGNRCVTFVTDDGSNDSSIESYNRPTLESIKDEAGIVDTDIALLSELIINPQQVYLGNIYGGNSYEEKKRSIYLEIGEYNDINTTSVTIDNPADTYVQEFKFARMVKTDTESFALGLHQETELVSVILETVIDLKNRHDISRSEWDDRWQPNNDEYHQYNDVYTQQPTLVLNQDEDFSFRRVKNFDTRIQASKVKIPNEDVDSWTDILTNEVMDLDGKYGPINGLISFKDEIFTFQDEAIASIAVNPRIQVQGNDGIGIELGTGGVLYDYKYITTKSGSINKWGIVPTKNHIYYYDALNKGIGRVPDSINFLLSDKKGLHTFFNNNYNYSAISVDNPLLGTGIVLGYDNFNNDIYITALQGSNSFTWCYSDALDEFIDLKPGYNNPSRYIYKGEKFFIPDAVNNKLYEQYKGEYNQWFDNNESSYITLMINPESDMSCVFDNVFYKSELYLNDIDQPNETLTHIQAYNEYQDSGRIPLVAGRTSNLRRKFRKWQANIPRDGRNRLRNPWIFLKLELENSSNYRMILHDIIISYTV